MRLAVIDYRINNIGSLVRSLQLCGIDPSVARDGNDLTGADKVILPGVGAFGDGMQKLDELGFTQALKQFVLVEKKPLLGICLGMQLLAKAGDEGRFCQGLGFLDFSIEKLTPASDERLPHIGWNSISKHSESKLLAGLPDGADFYFVHSYGARIGNSRTSCVATVDYAGGFAAVVESDNIFGVQFHPEKSYPFGFTVLKNFLNL